MVGVQWSGFGAGVGDALRNTQEQALVGTLFSWLVGKRLVVLLPDCRASAHLHPWHHRPVLRSTRAALQLGRREECQVRRSWPAPVFLIV